MLVKKSEISNVTSHQADKVNVEDFFMTTINGDIVNLTSKYSKLVFYESMFSAFISGYVEIKDVEGLLEKHRITGGEQITFKMSKVTTKEIITWRQDLIVESISENDILENMRTNFTLRFVSKAMIKSMKRKVFKTFKNQTIEQCVKSVYAEISDNSILVEDSSITLSSPFISTGFNPHNVIEFLSKRACANGKFYVFFERLSPIVGTLNNSPYVAPHYFGSMEKIINDSKSEDIYQIVYSDKTLGQIESSTGKNLRTKKIKRLSTFNHIESMLTGLYNSKIVSIDPITRKHNMKKMSYVNDDVKGDFYSYRPFSNKSIFSTYDDLKYEVPGEKLIIRSYNDLTSRENWIESHIYGQVSKNIFKIETVIEGGTNKVGVGSVVYLSIPSHFERVLSPQNPKNQEDRIYSGKYIVTDVTHVINSPNQYVKKLELSRGSIPINIETDTSNVTEVKTASKPLQNVTNINKDEKAYSLREVRTYPNVIGKNRVKFLKYELTIERNADGTLSDKSKSTLSNLGIKVQNGILTDGSCRNIAKSIKYGEFDNIEDVIFLTYTSNIKDITPERLEKIKTTIKGFLWDF